MATVIYKKGKKQKFCPGCPLKDQLKDADMVKITVLDDNGNSAKDFLLRLNKDILNGSIPCVPIEVDRQDSILGARIARQAKMVNKNLQYSNLVEKLVYMQKYIDDKLNDIINYINHREK